MTSPLLGVELSCLHLSWWLPSGPSLPAPRKGCPSSQVWLRHFSMGNSYRAPRPHTMNPSAWFLSLHVMKNSLGTESGLCVGICASLRSSSIQNSTPMGEERGGQRKRKRGRKDLISQSTAETQIATTSFLENNTASTHKRLPFSLLLPTAMNSLKSLTLFNSEQVAQFCWWMKLDRLRIHHVRQRQEGVVIRGRQVRQGQGVAALLAVRAWATDAAVQNLRAQEGVCAGNATHRLPPDGLSNDSSPWEAGFLLDNSWEHQILSVLKHLLAMNMLISLLLYRWQKESKSQQAGFLALYVVAHAWCCSHPRRHERGDDEARDGPQVPHHPQWQSEWKPSAETADLVHKRSQIWIHVTHDTNEDLEGPIWYAF